MSSFKHWPGCTRGLGLECDCPSEFADEKKAAPSLLPLVKLVEQMQHDVCRCPQSPHHSAECFSAPCWRCRWEAALAEARKHAERRMQDMNDDYAAIVENVLRDIIGEAGRGEK